LAFFLCIMCLRFCFFGLLSGGVVGCGLLRCCLVPSVQSLFSVPLLYLLFLFLVLGFSPGFPSLHSLLLTIDFENQRGKVGFSGSLMAILISFLCFFPWWPFPFFIYFFLMVLYWSCGYFAIAFSQTPTVILINFSASLQFISTQNPLPILSVFSL